MRAHSFVQFRRAAAGTATACIASQWCVIQRRRDVVTDKLQAHVQKRTRGGAASEQQDPQPQSKRAVRSAQQTLFPEASIHQTWQTARPVGAGLINLGNTCFMNSVLQAITHVPAFAELCLARQPLPNSKQHNGHVTADVQNHVRKALSSGGPQGSVSGSLRPTAPFRPAPLAKGLRTVKRGFRLGRQEDAHEYLRCLLDCMHESQLAAHSAKPPPEAQRTTWIHAVFGGRTRSQVQCIGVKYESSIFEPFLDLSLQIHRCKTLQQALSTYCAKEVLDGDNKYRCPLNKKLVCAERSTRIQEPPNILTLHLKRFEFATFGRKISRHIAFSMELDLAPYMHETAERGNHKYSLVSVVVHHGSHVSSGHYTAYIKAASGQWYLCDDARVSRVKPEMVLKQHAYILLYARHAPRTWLLPGTSQPAAAPASATKAAVRQSAPHGSAAARSAQPENGASTEGAEPPSHASAPSTAVADTQADTMPAASPSEAPGSASKQSEREPASAAAASTRARSAATPLRNCKVSKAMAHKLPVYGRSQRSARVLTQATQGGVAKVGRSRRMLSRITALQPEDSETNVSPSLPRTEQGAPSSAAADVAPSAEVESPAAQAPASHASVAPAATQSHDVLAGAAPAKKQVQEEQPMPSGPPQGVHAAEPPHPQRTSAKRPIDPVSDDLLHPLGHDTLAGLGTWDDADQNDMSAAQRMVQDAQPVRHELDAYDAEYDIGKTKKVKRKHHEKGAGPGADAFVKAAQENASGGKAATPRKTKKPRVHAMQAAS